jgi:hypothetical protein
MIPIESYTKGDNVVVKLPGGDCKGEIIEVLPGFSFGAETQYRVVGNGFDAKFSARQIRKNGRLW